MSDEKCPMLRIPLAAAFKYQPNFERGMAYGNTICLVLYDYLKICQPMKSILADCDNMG